jgi:hypothetical protein
MRVVQTFAVLTVLVGSWVAAPWARAEEALETPALAVGPQYETSHVYVSPEDVERFRASLVATFGGTKSQQAILTVTPTPSETIWQAVLTPVGSFSVFGFKTPIPYPFGLERTGYLVKDFDSAVRSAKKQHHDLLRAKPLLRHTLAPFQAHPLTKLGPRNPGQVKPMLRQKRAS